MDNVKPALRVKRRAESPHAAGLVSSGISPVMARIFAARGVRDILETRYGFSVLPHFSQMKNCVETGQRLAKAIKRREKIVIVADYDVDGATACAVAVRGLRAMGAEVDYIIPNRFTRGYGLSPEIVEDAIALHAPKIILTVDNGMTAVDATKLAKARGIDVIITDHHLPGDTLPDTPFIVNPNQAGCGFPSKNLAGVAVMFYVLTALRARLREDDEKVAQNLGTLIDLVALGTVADVVPLDHINRALVNDGLKRVRHHRAHVGIAALFDVGRRACDKADAFDFGFVVAPRLNAAGRLSDMTLGARCLLTDDLMEAMSLATELERLNQERKSVESEIQENARAVLQEMPIKVEDKFTITLANAAWHTGVIGIVASRLKDQYHRPTFVFGGDENQGSEESLDDANDPILRGSGRSIPGLHLRDALDRVAKRAPGLIKKFGGHAMAAGLSIKKSGFSQFAALFEAVVSELITPDQLTGVIETDGALSPDAITLDLAREIRGNIWGQSFPAPTFDNRFAVISQRVLKEKHSKLALSLGGQTFNAILFGDATPMPPFIHAVYRVDTNEYQGATSLQLVLSHWMPASGRD